MRLLRQPILYFVLLGVVVFLVDGWLRHESAAITVAPTVRGELEAELRRTLSRAPSEAELERAVADWTTTELLFREATHLGLQENDALIRVHLATKLKNLVKQRTIVPPPSETELRAQFDAHPEHYTKPDTYDITVVFVTQGASPEAHATRVEELRAKLTTGLDPRGAGDHFPRGPALEDVLLVQLEQILKAKLEEALQPKNQGRWQHIPNPRGSYLLRLDRVNSGRPNFESLKQVIGVEVETQKRDAAFARFVEELRSKYPVTYVP